MSLTKSILRSTGGGSLLASTLAASIVGNKRPEVASRRATDNRARTKNLKLACTRLILMPDPSPPVYGENAICIFCSGPRARRRFELGKIILPPVTPQTSSIEPLQVMVAVRIAALERGRSHWKGVGPTERKGGRKGQERVSPTYLTNSPCPAE